MNFSPTSNFTEQLAATLTDVNLTGNKNCFLYVEKLCLRVISCYLIKKNVKDKQWKGTTGIHLKSPFIFNFCQRHACCGKTVFLYADDSTILVSGKDIHSIEKELSEDLRSVSNWLIDKQSLRLGKTKSILFGSRSKLRFTHSLNITRNDIEIQTKMSVKYLSSYTWSVSLLWYCCHFYHSEN